MLLDFQTAGLLVAAFAVTALCVFTLVHTNIR